METRTAMRREQEEQTSQMSHSMELSSHIKKKTFTSSDEEPSYAEYYPIIPGDVMSAKELLGKFPRHRTWEVLKDTMAADEEYYRDKWTMFGNECEKVEIEVIRNQHVIRTRVDHMALRKQAERKATVHLKYLEDLSRKAPDFIIPLRAHAVWEGMSVKLSCTVQGCPPPKVTWYKDGVPLSSYSQPWTHSLQQKFGLNSLEIRRCSPEDAGEYKVAAKSPLGEASTFGTLVVNSYQGTVAGSEHLQIPVVPALDPQAQFDTTFQPTRVKEGGNLTLQCSFTSNLLPFQQNITWFRDGVQLHQSSRVDIQTTGASASITLTGAHKEHEGMYSVRLTTWDGVQEHSSFVYVIDGSAAVLGGPASPLSVQVSDINKGFVFLTWEPPSADGASPVQGYYVERYDIGQAQWLRCNDMVQTACHYPVFGLKEGTMYQFRVCAVNQAGVGRPSKATEPVLTLDPLEPTRTMVVKVDRGREITITKDQLEGQIKVPLPPTDVHACEVSNTYVVLCWAEPEPRGREPLTFYVERSLAGKNSWKLASMDMLVNSPRFPMFDLEKGKQYCFRVRAINKYGVSDPSDPSAPISLGEPQVVPPPPHSVVAVINTDTSVLLQWQEPKHKDDVLGYYLYYSEAGTQGWSTINNKPVTKTRFTVHGLKKNKEYVFRVKSVGRAGNSKYSDESSPTLVKSAIFAPSSPSAIALLLCTGSEMVLSWRAPAWNGGEPVCGYYLDQRDSGLATWREVNTKPAKDRQHTVSNLSSGHYYQFRVFAANVVGVGKASEASEDFLCEEWTMPEPGCPYDLQFREVRKDSLVLLWAVPLYGGLSPITGYLLECNVTDQSESWTAVNDEPTSKTFYTMSGLKEGQMYRFRVSAVNEAGVGSVSLPTEPITAHTQKGTKNIEIGVDNDGFIFLTYETTETTEKSEFFWSKSYGESIDGARVRVENKNNRSVVTFTDPTEEDLGLYTVEMKNNTSLSSSYNFTAEDLERLTELGWHVRNPLIALKSGWQVDVSEKGSVRLWLQTESLSNAAELRLICNAQEISSTPHRKINFDKASGLVEILFDQPSQEDEGSYTAQLKDGRAKNQFTLVFVDKKFLQTLALSAANQKNHKRKSGPYFLDYLTWIVTRDCELIMRCKVTNVTKDTTLKWSKDGMQVEAVYDQSSGISTLVIPQVTQADAGVYKAVISDGRGEDDSTLELLNEEFDKLLQCLSKQSALSAGPMKLQCTADGFKFFCSLKYYLNYLKNSWHLKEKRIDQEARCKPATSMQRVWVEVFNPTENDQGKYTLEMFDGQETHKRHLELSGQAFADALLEFQRLKQVAFAEKNRARVTKGLPDVVTIREGKSLCLTCFVDGDPAPEMFWLRNDREITNQGQFTITKEPKSTSLTVNNVTMENSGNYNIFVRNKHGTQTVNVTVSIYKHGDKPPANAVEFD